MYISIHHYHYISDMFKRFKNKTPRVIFFRFCVGIGTELLRNVMERQLPEYEWFDIKVISGVFTDKVSQRIAASLGMETLYEFVYSAWTPTNKTTGEQEEFFMEIVRENYSAKVMSVKVGPSSSSVHSDRRSNEIDEQDITL